MNLQEFKKEMFKNPEFKKEYERFDLWFEIQQWWFELKIRLKRFSRPQLSMKKKLKKHKHKFINKWLWSKIRFAEVCECGYIVPGENNWGPD